MQEIKYAVYVKFNQHLSMTFHIWSAVVETEMGKDRPYRPGVTDLIETHFQIN